jgi:hypothetical protein
VSWRAEMRTMFVLYLMLIVLGIAYFMTIGLLQN